MPPRDVREALDAFLQSVVQITGGDTPLPDQLADAAKAAFAAVARDVLAHDEKIAATMAEAAYARDPDVASKKADALARRLREKEAEALRRAMGPIDTSKFGAFRERAAALAALARRGAGEGGARGEKKPSRRETEDVSRARDANAGEYGADVAFVAPGTRLAADAAEDRGADARAANATRAGDSAAAAMRASLAEAASAETERAASIAGARASFASAGAGFAGFGENATETGSGEKNVTASAATAQLAWLKARCLEISGSENWELAAQTVARLALASPDDKSDDAVAAELFDFFGDAGVELIMGAIERRGGGCDVVGQRQQRRMRIVQERRNGMRRRKAVLHGRKVARTTAAQRKARERGGHIGRGFQMIAQHVPRSARHALRLRVRGLVEPLGQRDDLAHLWQNTRLDRQLG